MTEHKARIVLMMGISLDGFVAVPNGDGLSPVMEGGDLPPEDPELTKAKLDWIWKAGAHLMGRNTYEEMASFWPTSKHEYAAPMNEIPNVVFSKSLERADWPESRIAAASRSRIAALCATKSAFARPEFRGAQANPQ